MTCLKGRTCWASTIVMFMSFMFRETRRERILENRAKAIKVAEKQAAMVSRRKEGEKKAKEEKLLKEGCPIAKAEKAFFENINRRRKERECKSGGVEPFKID